eukprot:PITA_13685
MVEEYDSIVRNNVWDLVPRLENKSVLSSHWISKVKQDVDGSVEKHKTRFFAVDFHRLRGLTMMRLFLLLQGTHLSELCWHYHHRWLKKTPRAFYTKIDNYFTGFSFIKSEVDVNLYHIVVKGKLLIIILYVDDLILTGDDELIMSCKENLAREFEMKDMGLMHYFLGMEVWQKDGELFVSQGKYANEILRRFHTEKCKPMQTPLVGNWMKEVATSREVVEATMYR